MRKKLMILLAVFALWFGVSGCMEPTVSEYENEHAVTVAEVPEFDQEPYVVIADNIPDFSEADMTTESFEHYSQLDELDRCGTACANIGQDLMPTEERGSIGSVKPSGWQTVKYSNVDGKYLYNRCHLIGYQLTGENANDENLITGTRYMNVEGMLPFEDMVADYVKETDHHVLYRVTPIFEGDNLVASGVQMEAESVEDHGEGIQFNVYVYNNQPGIEIDYQTGDSRRAENGSSGQASDANSAKRDNPAALSDSAQNTYVLNTSSRRFHKPDCHGVSTMSPDNRQDYQGSRDVLMEKGYKPCGNCNP